MKRYAAYIILLLLALSVVNIILLDVFTFVLTPDRGISGNGNPAIIFLLSFILLYIGLIVLLFLKYRYIGSKSLPYIFLLLGIIGTIVSFVCLWIFITTKYQSFGDRLEGFAILNQYTNTIFVNF